MNNKIVTISKQSEAVMKLGIEYRRKLALLKAGIKGNING